MTSCHHEVVGHNLCDTGDSYARIHKRDPYDHGIVGLRSAMILIHEFHNWEISQLGNYDLGDVSPMVLQDREIFSILDSIFVIVLKISID